MCRLNERDDREKRLESWINTYGTSILRTCLVCLSDLKEAEDAMQETFLKAWRSMEQFEHRNGASEKTWLIRIAMNVCRDIKRTRWFRHVDMSLALEDLPEVFTMVEPEDHALMIDVMRMPDKYRRPFLLHFYHALPLSETAEILGLSKSTVYNRLEKAKQLLKLSEGRCQ